METTLQLSWSSHSKRHPLSKRERQEDYKQDVSEDQVGNSQNFLRKFVVFFVTYSATVFFFGVVIH